MKVTFLSVLISLVFSVSLFSQEKKIEKLIKEYDVIQYVEKLEKGKAELFWREVVSNNEGFMKFYIALNKEKPLAK